MQQDSLTTNHSVAAPRRQWYAMRVTYHREQAVKSQLDMAGMESYLPMRHVLRLNGNRKVRLSVPLVSSLIFVHSDKQALQRFKLRLPHLQYMTMRTRGKSEPIIVPEKQMDDFMRVTSLEGRSMTILTPDELAATRGRMVRVHGGLFDGVEGRLTRITGRRNKRLVIELHDVISVAVECSDASFVELI